MPSGFLRHTLAIGLCSSLLLAGCNNDDNTPRYPASTVAPVTVPMATTKFLVSSSDYVATESTAASASSKTIVYQMPAVTGTGTFDARAVVLVPKGTAPAQGWPMVVWAHGTTGVADGCEPSATNNLAQYDALLANLVQRGYMVVAPDYEGLGNSPAANHPYLNRDSEGRAMIYAAMAAREQVPNAGVRWMAVGHSQGGHAAIAAAELAAEANQKAGLQLRGVVAMAPASNLDAALMGTRQQITQLEAPLTALITEAMQLQAQAQAAQAAGNLAQAQQLGAQARAKQAEAQAWSASAAGQAALTQATALTAQLNFFGSLVVAGERAVMPTLKFEDVFGARTAPIAASTETTGTCNAQILGQFANTDPAALGDLIKYVKVEGKLPSTYPGLNSSFLASAAGQDFLNRSRIGTKALNVPVLIIQGEDDTTVTRPLTDLLVQQMAQAGNATSTVAENFAPTVNVGVNYQVLGKAADVTVDHTGVVQAGATSTVLFLNQVR